MPSRCVVRVIEARDLPLMDRDLAGAEFTDAFVEVRFANFEPCRTAVRRTQQPKWDEEFRFEIVDDAVLQASPIEFKVMDHDVITADDTIGLAYVDLSPLLMRLEPEARLRLSARLQNGGGKLV